MRIIISLLMILAFILVGCSQEGMDVSPTHMQESVDCRADGIAKNEEEFVKGIINGEPDYAAWGLTNWGYYYRPAATPEGFDLTEIVFAGGYVVYRYENEAKEEYEFAWSVNLGIEAVEDYMGQSGGKQIKIPGAKEDMFIVNGYGIEFEDAITDVQYRTDDRNGMGVRNGWEIFYSADGTAFQIVFPFSIPYEDFGKLIQVERVEIKKEEDSSDMIVNEPIKNDIAEHISYDSTNRSIYIAGLKIFKEFGTKEFGFSNEGSSAIVEDENALIFNMTIATGSVTGALDGPTVYFKMDLDTNQILEKEFGPAPNYEELGMTEFTEHSEEVIEIRDERMVEIGLYFKDFILQIEASSFEQTIEEKLTDIVNPKNKEISLSSNPNDYIKDQDGKENYEYIVSQGERSLNYMLNKFANSNSNGLQEYIMAMACSEVLKEDAASKDWSTGREWYEKYMKSNQ